MLEYVNGELKDVTTLTGRKVEYKNTSINHTFTNAPSASEWVEIKPPVGEIWHYKTMRMEIPGPSTATSGSHSMYIGAYFMNVLLSPTYASNSFDDYLVIKRNIFEVASVNSPSTEAAQVENLLDISVTNESPFFIYYLNLTDATQDQSVPINIFWEVEPRA